MANANHSESSPLRSLQTAEKTPRRRLSDHIVASRSIVDLAVVVADHQENDPGVEFIDPATMRRALQEVLRHLVQAETILHELPRARS
jgi:hypothetical protein